MKRLGSIISIALTFSVLSCGPAPSTTGKSTMLVQQLPDGVQGLELRDGALHLADGYKFVKQSANAFMIIDSEGETGASGGCGCKAGGGTCEPKNSGGIIVCSGSCGKCGLAVTAGATRTEIALFE